MQRKGLILIFILYLLSAVGSYATFSYLGKGKRIVVTGPGGKLEEEGESPLSLLLQIDPNEPKTEVCPLNGKFYTKTEKTAWEKKRPLAVMIENTPDARPQSGLSDADVVFEAVAEGGVTRFMAMFYCGAQVADVTVAPVRSARTYFIDYASGFNRPLYAHVGGANIPGPADALGQLSEYGWNMNNDLNQFSIGYPTFTRDYNRLPGKEIATEHTMVSSTEKLWDVGAKRDWTFTDPDGEAWIDGFEPWSFEEKEGETGSVNKIAYDFWSGYDQYAVVWQFNPESKNYMRSQGGEAHVDLNNDDRVEAKNVIVILTTEKGPIDEKKHMLYGTTGTGDALIFKNGQAIEGTWVKKTRVSPLVFKDSKGKDVELARGLTWISVLNQSTDVEY